MSILALHPARPARPRRRWAHPQPACPRCGSDRTHRHGFFRWKDGAYRRRFLCRSCGRTFNRHTDTPLHYLKKRDQWAQQAPGIGQALSIRQMAAALGVRIPTAFRWRHGILTALGRCPQFRLEGVVGVGEAYVPYSEKGSRKTRGPGAWRQAPHASVPGQPRFRRFVDGKPSCVLLVCSADRLAMMIAGRGRPTAKEVGACLVTLIKRGAQVKADELATYAEACRHHGFIHKNLLEPGNPNGKRGIWASLDHLRTQLFSWLWRFRGVATRYLPNYLVWLRLARLTPGQSPASAGRHMLVAVIPVPFGPLAHPT